MKTLRMHNLERGTERENGAATDGVIMKEQTKVLGQQMCETNFIHKNSYVFCSKK
jgi:hypothetical protein